MSLSILMGRLRRVLYLSNLLYPKQRSIYLSKVDTEFILMRILYK